MNEPQRARRDETSRSFEDRFPKFVLSVVAVLFASGVAAIWNMSSTLARVEERVALWQQHFQSQIGTTNRDVTLLGRRVDRQETRINDLLERARNGGARPFGDIPHGLEKKE